MSQSVLLVDKSEGIATLTFNRPEQRNALSVELRERFADEVADLRGDRDIGVVILTGAGSAFCAGLDLKEMGDPEGPRSNVADPAQLLRSLEQPVIGAINGVAVTGGFEIALSCDMLVATPAAKFADTHARVGLIAGWGLGARLSRAVGLARAKELSLTGNFLSAEQACDWGLVNRVVPQDELLATCRALATDICSCIPEVVYRYKRQIDRCYDLPLGAAMTHEAEICRLHQPPRPEEVEERRRRIQSRGRHQAAAEPSGP